MFTLVRWAILALALILLVGWVTSVGPAHAIPVAEHFSQTVYGKFHNFVSGGTKNG